MEESVEIRLATPADSGVVAETGRSTFYETWRDVNTEEDMQLYMRKAFDPENVSKEVEETTNNTFLLARQKDIVLGYVKLRRDRTYDEFKGSKVIELERIYVKKKFQQQKIGSKLMNRCLEISRDEKFSWLWLAVNKENFTAIDFYKKFGFEIFGTKYFQLGNAQDEDYLMKLRIN